jgi:peptide/nickel transport system permease protein
VRRYLLSRFWQSIVTLILATIVVFVGVRALPGDPALALAGEDRDPESLQAIREQYGLDRLTAGAVLAVRESRGPR